MSRAFKSISTYAIIVFLFIVQSTSAEDKVVVVPMVAGSQKLMTAYSHNGTVGIELETVINSVSITVPQTGTIIANSTATVAENVADEVKCGIYASTTYEEAYANIVQASYNQLIRGTIANLRHFQVGAGTHTFYQICKVSLGAEAIALKSDLSLLFIGE